MKRILSLVIVLLMALSIAVVAVADDPTEETEEAASPQGNGGPTITKSTSEAPFIVTWYQHRSSLPAEEKEEMEEAYSKVEEALEEEAHGANVRISDVFNVRETHPGRANFPVSLSVRADGLDHFAGLGYYNKGTRKWMQVPATVSANKNRLSLQVEAVGTYAIAEFVQD